jgi:hypothetical protein
MQGGQRVVGEGGAMKSILTVACAALLLAGCSKSTDDAPSGDDAAVQATPVTTGDNKHPAYRATMLGLAAGSYGGTCNGIGGPMPPEGVTIGRDGRVVAADWTINLAGTRMSLVRTLDGGAAPAGIFDASGGERPFQLIVNSAGGGSAMFGEGGHVAQCTNVSSASNLAAKPLYPAVAQYFTGAGATMSCVEGGALRKMVVKPASAGVAFGEHQLGFDANVVQESISVEADDSSLQYGAKYADQSHVELSVDAAGKLVMASYTISSGVAVMCSPG